ncbi:MAG: hypothetical protein GF411_14200 [Candidatus Lokiarchaeota archaeon]|nr:hypothetical protein [Candidatus Lokiarchaeota archaeon]
MDKFNAGCPCVGGYLNRDHIQRYRTATHVTHQLYIKDNRLCADIELIDQSYDISKLTIKPIIISPFDDEDVIRIIDIKDVRIYEEPQP